MFEEELKILFLYSPIFHFLESLPSLKSSELSPTWFCSGMLVNQWFQSLDPKHRRPYKFFVISHDHILIMFSVSFIDSVKQWFETICARKTFEIQTTKLLLFFASINALCKFFLSLVFAPRLVHCRTVLHTFC